MNEEPFGRRLEDDRLLRLEQSHQGLTVQVGKLVTEVQTYHGNQEQMIMLMQRTLDRHEQQLNGFNSTPGLRMEVDRTKNTVNAWQRHIWAIWLVIVGLVGKRLVEMWK